MRVLLIGHLDHSGIQELDCDAVEAPDWIIVQQGLDKDANGNIVVYVSRQQPEQFRLLKYELVGYRENDRMPMYKFSTELDH